MNPQFLGLTTKEAQERLAQYGPNAIQEMEKSPILEFFLKFWSPVPWLLESTFILQMTLGKTNEAVITFCLLVFNALVGYMQERKAQSALSLLRKQLKIKARVLRNEVWIFLDAQEIVKDDVIRVRMGDFLPADVKLIEGNVLVDSSAITGESLPVELSAGSPAFSGSIVKRGEATGVVTATGKRSFFGRTAELVRAAKTEGHFEKTVLNIVRYLITIDAFLVAIILIYASIKDMSLSIVLPFALVLLVVSIPVALPAAFTLMSSLAALKLAGRGILVTKITAIEEAAAMNVLCSDKTGTLTKNSLILKDLKPHLLLSTAELLEMAALASNEASQDPFDTAILSLAHKHGIPFSKERLQFIPFEPMTKRSEAIVQYPDHIRHIVKGAPLPIISLSGGGAELLEESESLAAQGARVLAVAFHEGNQWTFAGFLTFSDPVREESRQTINDLRALGVQIKMVTGDSSATAKAIAAEVGIGERIGHKEDIVSKSVDEYDIFAEVFPEDKFNLVQVLQQKDYIVGMTGDGVNDAPALKQANIGIAVSNATDVAKAAASLILTNPGLGNVIKAVKEGREVYRRMLTYTLNKVVKTTNVALFLSLGLLIEDVFILTPRLVMFLIFANDFVTMSLASDNVRMPKEPCLLKIKFLVLTSLILALSWLIFNFAVFYAARDWFRLSLDSLQTLMFVMSVFTGLATVYLIRTRMHFWKIRPGKLLIASTVGDIMVVSAMACFGILMEPVSLDIILLLGISVVVFMFALDQIKALVFRRYQ